MPSTAYQATFDVEVSITASMIVPITDDASWQERLRDVQPLEPLTGPVVVIAPHPDDETLGAGGLIATLSAQGTRVSIVAATDGENAYDLSLDKRRSLGHTREREQRRALEDLGVGADAIRRLRLMDSGLMDQGAELERGILEAVEPGMTILAPWHGDFHPDHIACAHAARSVSRAKNIPLLSYFFWTWHRGTPELLDGLPLRKFNPTTAALAAKTKAIEEHRSQLDREVGEPILDGRLLAPMRWSFEVFLSA